MSAQLKKHWSFIQLLVSTPKPQRLALLKTLTDEQLGVLCEIVLNTLQGHLSVPPQTIQTLKRYKTFLRSLTLKQLSKIKKKSAILSNHKVLIGLLHSIQPVLETFARQ